MDGCRPVVLRVLVVPASTTIPPDTRVSQLLCRGVGEGTGKVSCGKDVVRGQKPDRHGRDPSDVSTRGRGRTCGHVLWVHPVTIEENRTTTINKK